MRKRSIVAKKTAGLVLASMMLMSSVGTLCYSGDTFAAENGGAGTEESGDQKTKKTYIKSLRFYGNESDVGQDGVKGYTVIPFNLTKGKFWGTNIYLAYQTTTNPDEAITNIMTKYGDSDDISADEGYKDIDFYTLKTDYSLARLGYTQKRIDLNDNAGGDYIYMYYTKDKTAGAPITSITIDTNSAGAITCDLNKGNNGDHMWAHVTRDEEYFANHPYFMMAKNTKTINFNGKEWYIIQDNSINKSEGELTLLAKEPIVIHKFGNAFCNYAGSEIKDFLANYYEKEFSYVDKAVKSVDLPDVGVEGVKFFLPSKAEVEGLSKNVRKCSAISSNSWNAYWLRTNSASGSIMCVDGDKGNVIEYGYAGFAPCEVRPAIVVDLSQTSFSAEDNTLYVESETLETENHESVDNKEQEATSSDAEEVKEATSSDAEEVKKTEEEVDKKTEEAEEKAAAKKAEENEKAEEAKNAAEEAKNAQAEQKQTEEDMKSEQTEGAKEAATKESKEAKKAYEAEQEKKVDEAKKADDGTEYTWKCDSNGWWIENKNGTYVQNQWIKISGVWYYFKTDGYMASSEWIDGYWIGADGSWTYEGYGQWMESPNGWYFVDSSNWYPQSKWQKIDGNWYYFDAEGYMVTSQYVDGYWIGADGICR